MCGANHSLLRAVEHGGMQGQALGAAGGEAALQMKEWHVGRGVNVLSRL